MSKQPNPTPKEIGAMRPPAPPSPPTALPHPFKEIGVCGNCGSEMDEVSGKILFQGKIVRTFTCPFCKVKMESMKTR